MEQIDENSVYENVTNERKERRDNFVNPIFFDNSISKDSNDIDVENCSETNETVPRMERRNSSAFSEHSDRKERFLNTRSQSKSSIVKDSIGEDESNDDNPDTENSNHPKMERRRSSMFNYYQEREERFVNSNSSIDKDVVGEGEGTNYFGNVPIEGATPRPRMEKRQSSILSIVPNANIETVIAPIPKNFIPPKVEKTLLMIFVIICLAIVWFTILPLAGSEVYQGLVTRSLRNIPQNLSLPSIRLLGQLNISNLTVQCPEMFIFSPKDNSCKPQCGAWSGCGRSMYYVEKYSLIILDITGIIIGIFGNVSWLLDYKHWEWRNFAIVFSTNVAFVSSIAFAFLDVPGSRYLFCSNEDKPFEDVLGEGNIHIQVYSAVTTFLNFSFLFWMWFSLINITLTVFSAMSVTLQKRSFYKSLLIVESILAWGTPLSLIGLFTAAGGRFNLNFAIQHPVSNGSPPNLLLSIPCYILFRLVISTILLIFINIRFQIIKSQKFSTKRIKISSLEKRFIVIGVIYVVLIVLRSMYSSGISFSLKWELQNEGYAACVTLGSAFTTTRHNTTMSIFNNTSIVADLLPLPLKNIIPECSYPCILPISTILLRISWIIIFSITSLQPIYSILSRCSNRWRATSTNTKSTVFTSRNQTTLKYSSNSRASLGVSCSFPSSNSVNGHQPTFSITKLYHN